MTLQQVVKRYPLLVASLLALTKDTDVEWAASIVLNHKARPTEMSYGMLREAWRKRLARKQFKEATRVVWMFVDDVLDVPSTPTSSLPKAG